MEWQNATVVKSAMRKTKKTGLDSDALSPPHCAMQALLCVGIESKASKDNPALSFLTNANIAKSILIVKCYQVRYYQ